MACLQRQAQHAAVAAGLARKQLWDVGGKGEGQACGLIPWCSLAWQLQSQGESSLGSVNESRTRCCFLLCVYVVATSSCIGVDRVVLLAGGACGRTNVSPFACAPCSGGAGAHQEQRGSWDWAFCIMWHMFCCQFLLHHDKFCTCLFPAIVSKMCRLLCGCALLHVKVKAWCQK